MFAPFVGESRKIIRGSSVLLIILALLIASDYPRLYSVMIETVTRRVGIAIYWRSQEFVKGGFSLHEDLTLAHYSEHRRDPKPACSSGATSDRKFPSPARTVSRIFIQFPLITAADPGKYQRELMGELLRTPPDVFHNCS